MKNYYVPEQSSLPILATIGLFALVFGLGSYFNELKDGVSGSGSIHRFCWVYFFVCRFVFWFRQSIIENQQGLNSLQLKRSYVWGMGWFIFSEVMFFFAFFRCTFLRT